MSPDELSKKANKIWEEWQVYHYEVIEPRFYKEKRGRKMELINPWNSLQERTTVEAKEREFWLQLTAVQKEYYELTGEPFTDLHLLYKKKETPMGDRWIRIG